MILRNGLCHIVCYQHHTLVEWGPEEGKLGSRIRVSWDPARDEPTQVLREPHILGGFSRACRARPECLLRAGGDPLKLSLRKVIAIPDSGRCSQRPPCRETRVLNILHEFVCVKQVCARPQRPSASFCFPGTSGSSLRLQSCCFIL